MIETIEKRRSVRTYMKSSLTQNDEKKVIQCIKEVHEMKGPFGHHIRLSYHPKAYVDDDAPVKIGTYGFVKNAPSFISGTVMHTFKGLIDFGYLFEYLILKLTEMGLGTVWLAGTFQRKIFRSIIEDQELMPAITPIGYENTQYSLTEKLIRKRSKGDDRFPMVQLAFDQDFKTPFVMGENRVSIALECMRLGPSASNKQPWRVLIKDDALHLYLARTPNYAKMLSFDIQALDMGIALCHLTLGLEHNIKEPKILISRPDVPSDWDYIASIPI